MEQIDIKREGIGRYETQRQHCGSRSPNLVQHPEAVRKELTTKHQRASKQIPRSEKKTCSRRPVSTPHANLSDLREPPSPRVLATLCKPFEVVFLYKLIKLHWRYRFIQSKRFFHLDPHPKNHARCSQSTERREEQIRVGISRTRKEGIVCQQEGKRKHSRRDHWIGTAGSMGCGGDNPA